MVTSVETIEAEQTDPRPFQAETKDLLDLMINSLYTKREIFLRELISNASDALDRLRYESLTTPGIMGDDDRLEIRLDLDPEARTLTVSDTGIGMTLDEIALNLGTIARSGTKELRNKIRETGGGQSAEDLIGQFGVGFYSAFMVAERVEVVTRRAGETKGARWESKADGYFTVSEAEKNSRGTSVILHLRPVDTEVGLEDYTQTWRISDIVRRHSDFIPYPIRFLDRREEIEQDNFGQPLPGAEKRVVIDDRTLNSMKPLWSRSQSEVEEKDYVDFYKHLTHDMDAPLRTIVSKAEGLHEYHALLFIPSRAPSDLYYHAPDIGLRLYAKQVLIAEKSADLLPTYLRFVKGVVDAGELPLNISRQQLQNDVHLTKIRKWLTKKVLDSLEAMQKTDDEEYGNFWSAFGRALKEGVGSDFDNKDRLLPLLRFGSSHDASDLTTLDSYIERMKEDQTELYYITGESRSILEKSPHLEALTGEGYEVLYLTDPVDELLLQYLHDYKGKRLKSAAKGSLDIKKTDAAQDEDKRASFKPLIDFLEDSLKDEIKRAQLSSRLTKSPVCLTVDDFEESPWMERMLQRGKAGGPKRRRILEINPDHAINRRLLDRVSSNPEATDLAQYAHVLLGLAQLVEGAELDEPLAFIDGTTELLAQVLSESAGAADKPKRQRTTRSKADNTTES